ncbi:hypothetical protein HYR69_00550, partial [Candidatus Sumerlaeota bacterium]|nr:hypothetical protein [Candidatus Sumerlaeota bacterium]
MWKTKNPKPKPSAWELREGDLPSEEILAREPRLRGLENNPMYRLILWSRRTSLLRASIGLELNPIWGLLLPVGIIIWYFLGWFAAAMATFTLF